MDNAFEDESWAISSDHEDDIGTKIMTVNIDSNSNTSWGTVLLHSNTSKIKIDVFLRCHNNDTTVARSARARIFILQVCSFHSPRF